MRPQNGDVVRQEFGAVETHQQHETAAMAVAAREQAQVQARYIMAERRPRNIEQFRVTLEAACRRPGFAAKVEYAKPIGKELKNGKWQDKYAYGPSIRFIEAALQAYGNVFPEVATVHESPVARICRVSVTDLQANITYSTEVVIAKQVERKGKYDQKRDAWDPPKGREVISSRINSEGEPTYLVWATDDETLVKQNALLSKALRTNAQRLLPWDIVERCMQIAKETLAKEDKTDPDAAKRRLVDAFVVIGVEPIDLEAYLGHSLSRPLQPAELEGLRGIYTAIRDGEMTWEDVMASKGDTGSEELQDEVRARKLAEAEAAKQQRNTTRQNDGGTEKKQDAASGETEEIATQSGTNREIPPASTPGPPAQHADAAKTGKPLFGRRQS